MGNTQRVLPDRTFVHFIKGKLFKTNFEKLTEAVKVGNINMVRYLHSRNVRFDQTLKNGDTLAHVAVRFGRLGIVKFIAENVPLFDFNDRSLTGDTPLMLAVMTGNIKIIEYLVVYKCVDVNIAENRGFTPFIAACANGNLHIVELLVKHNANFKVRAKDGQTGMHRAAFYGNLEVLKYLIKELKMNVMVPDRKGNLSLHLACMKLNFSCVRLIIKASRLPATDLLHATNVNGVKPVDILVKVMNRLREYDELKEFTVEQIEEYIKDKTNYPIVKRDLSPTRSKSKSPTAFARLRSAFTFRDQTPATDNTPSHYDSTPNESFFTAMKPIETNMTPTHDRRHLDNTEEEILKYSKMMSDTFSDASPMFAYSVSKEPSLISLDATPKSALQNPKTVKFADDTFELKRRPPRISTEIPRSSLRLSSQTTHGSSDEQKHSVSTFIPAMKSRFSSQLKFLRKEEI